MGGKLDGVWIVYKEFCWLVEGIKVEKCVECLVVVWFLLGGVFGLVLLLIFLFWLWEFKVVDGESDFIYLLIILFYGLIFGLFILLIVIGVVLY